MIKRHFWLKCIFPCLILSSSANAAIITWTGQGNNNDMNDPANWSTNAVPGSSDTVVFNSQSSGIATNPTENAAPFSVLSFNFPFNASIFHFNFNNQTLTFTGGGITGSHTNPSITVTNTNNSSFPGDLIAFTGGAATTGSALITSANSGTLTGSLSGTAIGAIDSSLHATGAFTVANAGAITASNTGNDSTNGTGNNGVANMGSSQLKFDQSFTAGDHVSVSISNSGTFSGTNTSQGDAVAVVNGSQFISSGVFQSGDNFTCTVQNTGTDSSLGVGLSNIGQLNAAQVNLQSTGSVGNNCTWTISNTGINSSQTTNFPDFLAYLNDQQFYVGSIFNAEDNFSLTVNNTGIDSSTGYGGHQVAVINSNSGTTGNQILFHQGGAVGDYASIRATNSGTYSGTNTNGGSNVAGMNLQQIAIGDSTSPGTYTFFAGDHFTLQASNTGTDSSNGIGGNAVGTVSSDQITLFTPAVLGTHASITLSNSASFSGSASTTYVNVGSIGAGQFHCVGNFSANDYFTLNVSNSGTHTGSGVGGFFIGDLINGQQARFENGLLLGNHASITLSNYGSNSSNTTNNNQVGSFMGYGKQFLVQNQCEIGDDFNLEITNSGYDASTGSGGNFVGFFNNNTVDNTASQAHFANGGTVGDRASITISNTGTYQGSNTTSGNLIAVLAGQQLFSVSDFQAGRDFNLIVSNSGTDDASGQDNNSIGRVGGSQVEFGGACTLGQNALIALSNSGTNQDVTANFNTIGEINGSQMTVSGNFTAGTGLTIQATNSANEGTSNNLVGHITNSQIHFAQNCNLRDGSIIQALNSGTIDGSQIVFGQGFNVLSGKVILKAINQGTLGSFGIDIQGSNSGGNANIFLGNSSLNIGTTLSTFTIAGLDGDSTSLVQSQPQLIINTDAQTHAEFSGVIQDFPATSSTLLKTGAGSQKLSGINTFTGLTTIQEGTLVLNGSIVGDLFIDSLGILKGNGTIGGTLTNMGVISPGESIGTLTVGNYIHNGTYAVEVNGLGQSDLIHALGTATINGGTVVVSSVDGTFMLQQPYTIITADEGVIGTFTDATSAAFVTPTLSYDLNNVYLTLQSALTNAAESCNQLGVATNLDQIASLSDSQSLLIGTLANLSLNGAQEALESLSGFQYTQDVLVTEISTDRLLRRLYDPLRSLVTGRDCCTCEPSSQWTTWLETGYGFTNVHEDTSHKLNFDSYQITGGIQKSVCSDLTVGLAGSYEYDNVKYRNARGTRNTGFASVYGLYRPSGFYGLFDFVYGYSSNRFKRTIEVGNLEYKASSSPNFNLFTFYAETGIDLNWECVLIQPFLGLQVGKNWRGQIHENDANGWGLTIDNHDWTTTRSRLGLHLFTSNLCDCIDTSFDVAWNQRWSSTKNSTEGRFQQFGDSFLICGNQLDNYSIDYALTFSTCFCEDVRGYLELDGEWWQHANTFNALCGIEYTW